MSVAIIRPRSGLATGPLGSSAFGVAAAALPEAVEGALGLEAADLPVGLMGVPREGVTVSVTHPLMPAAIRSTAASAGIIEPPVRTVEIPGRLVTWALRHWGV